MTIKEFSIDLLKYNSQNNIKNDYEQIASEVRTKFTSKTTAKCIRWYYSKFKYIIQTSAVILDDEDIDLISFYYVLRHQPHITEEELAIALKKYEPYHKGSNLE